MTRPIFAALALLAALPSCTAAYGDTAACAQPEVLQLVADRLQRAGLPRRMLTEAIGQAPGPGPGIVLCAVWVQRVAYDTPRLGEIPASTLFAYQYRLQIRRNAAFLLPEDVTAGSR